ncbi:MAG: ATP-binding protein [Bdellovibrionales bacterium]|nr:ATP-binding protein [Bdellovibrionales bacterium]
MIQRLQKLDTKQSLFLFGARGTGKSTLLKQKFNSSNILWIDLLNYKKESLFSKNPDRLSFLISSKLYKKVIIDEIQKVPKLLDIIHHEIVKNKKIQFIMTGSSARKLKRGQANLLAGRAIAYYLHPFSYLELGKKFQLKTALQFGGMPEISNLKSKKEIILFLESYVENYLKEEILQEQIVRNIQPFKNFLEIMAQLNGETINYSKFAREVGSDHKTIQNYFSVLEDTLLGFFLPAYSHSIRKQQQKAPKFYLFDLGVKRALEGVLTIPIKKNTYSFGKTFEHFLILECFKLNHYLRKFYKFSYLKTKNGLEIDLIIQKPNKKEILVEIKSTDILRKDHVSKLNKFSKDWTYPHSKQLWSLDSNVQNIEGVKCLPWKIALKKLFQISN